MDLGDSAGAVRGVFLALYWALFPFAIAGLLTSIPYYRAVPGTRARYVWRTLDKVALVLGFTWWVVGGVKSALDEEWVWCGISALFACTDIWLYRSRHSDDEDDWFKGLGGRIKARLTPTHRKLAHG